VRVAVAAAIVIRCRPLSFSLAGRFLGVAPLYLDGCC